MITCSFSPLSPASGENTGELPLSPFKRITQYWTIATECTSAPRGSLVRGTDTVHPDQHLHPDAVATRCLREFVLDSTYKRGHVLRVFLRLAYFT